MCPTTSSTMATYFISRHPGASQWARQQNIQAIHLAHLLPQHIAPGDTVIGNLPVHLAALVCAQGARYLHLQISIPANLRGCELSAEQIEQLDARLVEMHCQAVG